MNLENIMLSEISQSQKDKYYVVLLIWSLNSQIHSNRAQNSGCWEAGAGGNRELLFNGHRISVWDDVNIPNVLFYLFYFILFIYLFVFGMSEVFYFLFTYLFLVLNAFTTFMFVQWSS